MADKDRGRPTWVRFSGIGVEFTASVVGPGLLGYWVDVHYDCSPYGVLIGLGLGLVGGMYNFIRESLAASREMRASEREKRPPQP